MRQLQTNRISAFFKFNMTTGAIIWQNKMQGDINNKVASSTYNEII